MRCSHFGAPLRLPIDATVDSVAKKATRAKPGPEADRLKIELEPEEALRRLLTKPPPPKDRDEEEDESEEDR